MLRFRDGDRGVSSGPRRRTTRAWPRAKRNLLLHARAENRCARVQALSLVTGSDLLAAYPPLRTLLFARRNNGRRRRVARQAFSESRRCLKNRAPAGRVEAQAPIVSRELLRGQPTRFESRCRIPSAKRLKKPARFAISSPHFSLQAVLCSLYTSCFRFCCPTN